MLKLALVGRPNVGKSALFNRICQKKIAIVDEQEGTTRDRLIGEAQFRDLPFFVMDTGGIDQQSEDPLKNFILESTYKGIEEADTIVMVVDGRVGITALDQEIAHHLLKSEKPLVLAVNKLDHASDAGLMHNFYNLGIKKILPISALNSPTMDPLLEMAWEGLVMTPKVEKEENFLAKLAILGRPNVGKSTLINAFLGEKRVIVSPIAGTTVDAVDIPCVLDDVSLLLIDTAGVRRRKKEKERVEKFATYKREEALKKADLALLVCDAREGMTQEEKKLVSDILNEGKSCILLFNKWDLVKGFRMEHVQTALKIESPFLADLPMLFISAKEGRNLDKVLDAIVNVTESHKQHIATGPLNRFIKNAMARNSPPVVDNKKLSIYYMTQIGTSPPKFMLFVNHPSNMSLSYKRYLINQMRKEFGFSGVPIEFVLRGKKVKTVDES